MGTRFKSSYRYERRTSQSLVPRFDQVGEQSKRKIRRVMDGGLDSKSPAEFGQCSGPSQKQLYLWKPDGRSLDACTKTYSPATPITRSHRLGRAFEWTASQTTTQEGDHCVLDLFSTLEIVDVGRNWRRGWRRAFSRFGGLHWLRWSMESSIQRHGRRPRRKARPHDSDSHPPRPLEDCQKTASSLSHDIAVQAPFGSGIANEQCLFDHFQNIIPIPQRGREHARSAVGQHSVLYEQEHCTSASGSGEPKLEDGIYETEEPDSKFLVWLLGIFSGF